MSDFWLEDDQARRWVPLRDVEAVVIDKVDETRWHLDAWTGKSRTRVAVAVYPTEAAAKAAAVQLRYRVEDQRRQAGE